VDAFYRSIHSNTGAYTVTGTITDAVTGQKVGARVQVLGPAGDQLAPVGAMWKVGTGEPFFYSDGEFTLQVPRGSVQVRVERGTEFTPWQRAVECDVPGDVALDIELERWCDPSAEGWHPGNLHVNYQETEDDPDRRLMYDSRVEDLRTMEISYVKREDKPYSSNKYSPGVLKEFSDERHYVQCGIETRHNMGGSHTYGFGHVLLLNLRNVVEPVSRGLLVDPLAPDYPPISYASDDTKQQGGIVIWCHNGHGIESPVAAILGKVDAISLWDTYWEDLHYEVWYGLLNCGIKLPASTGSDWFLDSGNRVYTKTQPEFEYGRWLQALREGRTFVTNGPILSISVDGREPGDTVRMQPGNSVTVNVDWSSHYAVHSVDVIANGAITHTERFPEGSVQGSFECELPVDTDGWIASRIGSTSRDSYARVIWAHTSPVYIDAGGIAPPERAIDAAVFIQQIEDSIAWLGDTAKFYTDQQRREVVDLFRQGQDLYRKLAINDGLSTANQKDGPSSDFDAS
jgi:hypothetical protein